MTRPATRLDDLVRFIVATHHDYARRTLPEIAHRLQELAVRGGDERSELRLVRQTFDYLSTALLSHLAKEEHVLFPYLCDLAEAGAAQAALPAGPFGTLANPIRVMEDEHLAVLKMLDCLRDLTHGYRPPTPEWPDLADCYEALRLLDADLRAHFFLEEHDLYPRGLELEARLT